MSARFDMANGDHYRCACEMGATWYKAIIIRSANTGQIRDLTGYTSKMEIRPAEVRLADPAVVILTPTIVVTGAEGKVESMATATATAALTACLYYYDWIITSPTGIVERVLEGTFQVTARITV